MGLADEEIFALVTLVGALYGYRWGSGVDRLTLPRPWVATYPVLVIDPPAAKKPDP